MAFIHGRSQTVVVARPRPISPRVFRSSIGGWLPSQWETESQTDPVDDENHESESARQETLPHHHRPLDSQDLIVTTLEDDDANEFEAEAFIHGRQELEYEQENSEPDNQDFHVGRPVLADDLDEDDFAALGFAETNGDLDELEPNAGSGEVPEVVLTRSHYAQVLQLSRPMRFSLPRIPPLSNPVQNSMNENETNPNHREPNDPSESSFEESMSRIERIQEELRDIRRMYDEILQLESHTQEDPEDFPSNLDVNSSTRRRTHHTHLFHSTDDEEEQEELESDHYRQQVTLQPLIHHQNDDAAIESEDHPDESSWQPASVFNRYFDEEDILGQEDDEDDVLDFEAHLDEYARTIRRQHEERFELFTHGVDSLVHRNTRQGRATEEPKFYLDSNGEPCVSYEIMPDTRLVREESSSCLSVKAPAYCRLDSNGDLDCVIAQNRSPLTRAREEQGVAVLVERRHRQSVEDKVLHFKEIKETWRDALGECVGR